MSTELRIFLIIVSVLALLYVVRKIRHSKMNISDSVFWIVFAVVMILLSIFPGIIEFLSWVLGIQSPQNLLFLLIIGLLVLKIFLMAIKLSQLQDKITLLAQKFAIEEFEKENKK
jgi:hypothetical protein